MKNNVLCTQNAYKCQVLLGPGRLYQQEILLLPNSSHWFHLAGAAKQNQPSHSTCPRDLSGTTDGTRVRTAHLLPLPSKQNILAKRSHPLSSLRERERERWGLL